MSLQFCVVAGVFQALLMVLFGVLVQYSDEALPPHKRKELPVLMTNNTCLNCDKRVNGITVFYPMFQDVHVMIYIGFGFLMTFLKKYGYGAVGYNFFIAAMVTQWATIVSGSFHQIYIEGQGHIGLNIQTLISAEFAAAAVLITYGAVLGKVSRLQLLVIGIAEVIFYGINEMIATKYLKYSDAGGSVIIHSFGAYFGLALSRVLHTKKGFNNSKEESMYHSDLFAMIGTVFLWLYWPSFNAVLVAPDYVAQHRSVINTYFSLASACVTTFALSPIFQRTSGKWKISMVHVQNATLAGGVAIGTASNMSVTPLGALLVGSGAGALSTLGYVFLTPLLTNYAKTHDTCGVNNLHGMPGVLGGIVGAIVAAQADTDTYGMEGLINVWSARGEGRTAQAQAGFQIAGLAVTLAIAIVGGIVTGFAVKWKIFEPPTQEQFFDDEDFWEVPNEESLQIQSD